MRIIFYLLLLLLSSLSTRADNTYQNSSERTQDKAYLKKLALESMTTLNLELHQRMLALGKCISNDAQRQDDGKPVEGCERARLRFEDVSDQLRYERK